jgi:hypothetical protein
LFILQRSPRFENNTFLLIFLSSLSQYINKNMIPLAPPSQEGMGEAFLAPQSAARAPPLQEGMGEASLAPQGAALAPPLQEGMGEASLAPQGTAPAPSSQKGMADASLAPQGAPPARTRPSTTRWTVSQASAWMGGGCVCPRREIIIFLLFILFIIFYSYANPLPSFIPCSLNLHNRQVDDRIAGEEEVLLKGVVVDVEAEEMEEEAVDLSVGIVGREVAIQQTACAREMVAQQERRRCNNQPAQERRSARRETVA